MITPPYLKSGDKVVIVSTERKVSEEEMKHAMEEMMSHHEEHA